MYIQNSKRLSLSATSAFLAHNPEFTANSYRTIVRASIEAILKTINESAHAASLQDSGINRVPFVAEETLQACFDPLWKKAVHGMLPAPEGLIVPRVRVHDPARTALLAGFVRPKNKLWCAYVGIFDLQRNPVLTTTFCPPGYRIQYESNEVVVAVNFTELRKGSAKAFWLQIKHPGGHASVHMFSLQGFGEYCDAVHTDMARNQNPDYLDMVQMFVDLGWI